MNKIIWFPGRENEAMKDVEILRGDLKKWATCVTTNGVTSEMNIELGEREIGGHWRRPKVKVNLCQVDCIEVKTAKKFSRWLQSHRLGHWTMKPTGTRRTPREFIVPTTRPVPDTFLLDPTNKGLSIAVRGNGRWPITEIPNPEVDGRHSTFVWHKPTPTHKLVEPGHLIKSRSSQGGSGSR